MTTPIDLEDDELAELRLAVHVLRRATEDGDLVRRTCPEAFLRLEAKVRAATAGPRVKSAAQRTREGYGAPQADAPDHRRTVPRQARAAIAYPPRHGKTLAQHAEEIGLPAELDRRAALPSPILQMVTPDTEQVITLIGPIAAGEAIWNTTTGQRHEFKGGETPEQVRAAFEAIGVKAVVRVAPDAPGDMLFPPRRR